MLQGFKDLDCYIYGVDSSTDPWLFIG